MGKGLLAQWRGRLVGRGVAAAALLAVPVMVAGVIGFNGGLTGVTGGFFSALDGPEPEAVGAVAAPGGGPPAGGGGPADPRPGGDADGPAPGDPGSDPTGGPGAPTAVPGTPTINVPGTPGVPAPVDDPQGNVDSVVDDLNRTVSGLLGNR